MTVARGRLLLAKLWRWASREFASVAAWFGRPRWRNMTISRHCRPCSRSLRLRPDRIPVGEVRGGEALELLKAWGTGHPGGIGTIHAGSAIGALHRLEQLIQEVVVTLPRALIAETISVIAVLAGRAATRRACRGQGCEAGGA